MEGHEHVKQSNATVALASHLYLSTASSLPGMGNQKKGLGIVGPMPVGGMRPRLLPSIAASPGSAHGTRGPAPRGLPPARRQSKQLPPLDRAVSPLSPLQSPAQEARAGFGPKRPVDDAAPTARRRLKTEQLRGLPRAAEGEAIDAKQWYQFLHMLRRHPESMEFVYLAPAKTDAVAFNPYDLQIVPHAEINQANFYTMSSSGVTHFVDGSVEFTPLDQWEREYHLFNQISQLNVFRMYKLWKGWALWKRCVCKRKQRDARAQLEKQLFVLNPIFQRSLQMLRQLCYELSVLRLHDLEPGQLHTLEQFVAKQRDQQARVEASLDTFSAATVDAVYQACDSAIKQLEERLYGRQGGAVDDAAAAAAASKHTSLHAPLAKAVLMKSESEGNQFNYAIKAARRSEKRRLLNFIRLADYMICDTLRVLLVDSVGDILDIVEHRPLPAIPPPQTPAADPAESITTDAKAAPALGGDKAAVAPAPVPKRTAVFRVEVLLEDEQLAFRPSSDAFMRKMDDTMSSFTDLLGVVKRLLSNQQLRGFVEDGSESEMTGNMTDLFLDDKHTDLISNVKHALMLAFSDAEEFRSGFLPYMQVSLTNRDLDIEEMRAEVAQGARTLAVFREDITKYNKQFDDISRLVVATEIGIILIDTHDLKETFLPSPKHCLEQISRLLPQLASARYQAFVAEVHEAHSRLTTPPSDVEEFVEFISFSQKCAEVGEEQEARYREVHAHYELMEEFRIAVPELEFAAYQTLSQDFAMYKSSLEVAEANKEEYVQRFTVDLSKEVEEVEKDGNALRERAQHEMVLDEASSMEAVLEFTGDLMVKMDALKAQAQRIRRHQKLFKVTEHEFEALASIADEIELKHTLWESEKEWKELTERWSKEKFLTIDTADMDEKITKYSKIVSKLERGLVPNKVVPKLKDRVMEYKDTLPVILALHNPSMKETHWAKVQSEVGHEMVRDENFTLGVLLDFQVGLYKDRILTISTEATQEATLEGMLHKVQNKWNSVEFTLNPYKESKDVFILGAVDEVMVALEDSMVQMTTITASRYVAGIRTEVEKMEKALKLFADVLEEWIECQKQWMYLESIFSAPDIQRQLPNESKSFFAVDKTFKDIMRRTRDRPNALMAGTQPMYLEQLTKANEILEKVQKNLEDYLETKRMSFPRFYFLSNDELLEILAQTKNVQAVQPHMSKCFDGIRSLDFGDDPKSIDIFAMNSAEGEKVNLGKNLKARGNVESWLTAVEQNMQSSLKRLAKQGWQNYPIMARRDWVLQQPAQLVLAVSQIFWAKAVEEAMKSDDVAGSLVTFLQLNIEQLGEMSEVVRGKLTGLERKICVALITIDVHARDIVQQLVSEGIYSNTDFGWQMQLRYSWDESSDDVRVLQVNAKFLYAYEYLGAQSRLVVTPMTDRCYMTLTGALHLKLGGAPAGPAGTGKTETTKDLGKALGIQCVVFNCGDNLDYKFMGKFFSGLAQCGAWACFDEFNRIDIEVLSVVAQQLLTIQNALKAGVPKFMFEGREMRLISTCGVFITMNPGYAGRTELPDNLKALFRPMSMMIPDYALVAEVMLFSEGFADAKTLSRKMVKLYKLSSEQLSQQDHYDFGMRAVKSVLVMAGSLKRANPHLSEDVVLIRAFKDSNLPKFLIDDINLFMAIISDLFPGVDIPPQDYGELKLAVEKSIEVGGLQIIPDFTMKVIQLFETFNVRFGVMLVGPTGGGKTECYRMLQAAMTLLRERGNKDPNFQKTNTFVLNPKCIKMGELYGEYNLLTNEWTDGLGSSMIRGCVQDTTAERKWVVFDGPVDAIWIENMNTVLDDNCTLCLPNGERIKLNPTTMRMLFEVQDLSVASPATVSRCGMVYVPAEVVGWRPYVTSWIARLSAQLTISPESAKSIHDLFDTYVDKGLEWVRKKGKENVPSVDINLVTSLSFIFQALVMPARGVDFSKPVRGEFISRLFAFAYVWGIGGNLASESMEGFDEFTRNIFDGVVSFPGAGTVFSYFVSNKEQNFRNWDDVVPAFSYNKALPYFELVVPTVDTTRYSFLLEVLLEVEKSVLFTGLTGVGKTAIVTNLFSQLATKNLLPLFVNFSAQTSAIDTQLFIESKLDKKRKTRFGAPVGKKIALFVDDVNMPAKEVYGAQPPVELLRQFMDFRGFYDRKKLFWKDVEDMTIVTACAPPGGGRNEVTPRFFRHFNMLCVPPPSEDSMRAIFSAIVSGFLTADFKPEFKSMVKPMVESCVDVYVRIAKELLPTPAKSHYTFNLRDISKVVQGILMITPSDCPDKAVMTRLWVHENMRVFHDRLINKEDKTYFMKMLYEMVRQRFELSTDFDELFNPKQPLMFGDYLRPGSTGADRRYQEISSMPKLLKVLDDYLDMYNQTSTNRMKLVFFVDAIEHISRVARILRQPRGNAMLVGVGGSGKQSLTRFAASMCEYKCKQIELTRGYDSKEFREDIKTLYRIAGILGQPVTFLFTDTQIVNEGFVEDINNLLNSGEVPGLFAPDEKERMINDIRSYCVEKGLPETRDVMYATFINRVRDNLHVVLCMSPVGDAFRSRCRQFPSLINCTTIDWYTEWPEEALSAVSDRFLQGVPLGSEAVAAAVAKMCVEIHTSVTVKADAFFQALRRRYYTTPKSYLDLINLYVQLLAEKRDEMTNARDRLLNGLNKLRETNEVVDSMKEELGKLQPILEEKTIATQKLVVQVSNDQKSAGETEATVSAEEAEVKKQTAETQVLKDDAQRDLDEVLPALEAAVNALNSLNKADITEIKSFPKPPSMVQMTMEGVCILLSEKPDWDTAKKVLSDTQFIKRLLEFDKDNIQPKVLNQIKKYIEDPIFIPENVQKQSKAATSLCVWVRAMDTYSKVAKVVEPKRQMLASAERNLVESAAKLKAKQDMLRDVKDRVAALQAQLRAAEYEQEDLKMQADTTAKRLQRAGKLTAALGDEAVRWKDTATAIGDDMELLVGDVFVSAACISYYGAFTGNYRDELVHAWVTRCKDLGIPVSGDASLRKTLSNPVEVREWNIWGLPTDVVSVDNGILVTRGKRWPLMIDPQGQANKWIRAMEAKAGLRIIKLTDPNFLRTLESSIRIGNPVLLEDIGETLDPALEPVLQKQIFKQGGRTLIRLGDSDVDYDVNFKFYMTTKMPNPHYLPEVCIKVTIINFTVTMSGLEDQLLGDVVRKERPDLEEQKDRLVVSISNDKKQLKDLEDKILKLLKESEGNILDDEILINTLNNSKVTSGVIQVRVKEAEETEKEINAAREQYRSVPNRGAILYFVVADLGLIDYMYQYSLTYFTQLFNYCIDASEKSDDLATRLQILMDFTTLFIYKNVCRGLFEEHKMIFSFLICTSILRASDEIRAIEWNFLLRGGVLLSDETPNPDPSWISPTAWNSAIGLKAAVPALKAVIDDVVMDPHAWRKWCESEPVHAAPLPGQWDTELDLFTKLLLIKVFREEKLVFAFAHYVAEKLGQPYTENPPFSLDDIFKDTIAATPVIFVLSTGADPTGMLQRFGEKMGRLPGEHLHIISLGQGQGPIAEATIAAALKSGDWVCLQNCHLAKSWMLNLAKIVEDFSRPNSDIHPEFRLWLTSMPSPYFPVPVLQNGIKITNEPPKGVRANLMRSYADLNPEFLDRCSKQQPWKKLVFAVAFFHAVLQERRKFGPLGWNIKYDFSNSDLECSMMTLRMFLEEQPEIPWKAMLYVTGQINYGGRVTDDQDRRCLMSILNKYYTPRVLEDDYAFTPSGTYRAPPAGPYQTFVEYIRGLPFAEAPEVFGMHENANIAFQLQETRKIVETVLGIQPRLSTGGGGMTPDEIVGHLADEIFDSLPAILDRDAAHETTFGIGYSGQMNSLGTVLGQELDRFNKLLKRVAGSLSELKKALHGLVVMSSDLELMYGKMLNNQVPELWNKVAYPSLKPLGSWVADLHKRVAFMRDWLENGAPRCFWLPGFFFPQGFMTGALQNHARKYQIPIDTLNYGFEVLAVASAAEVETGPEDGIFIDGLYLESARWDATRRCLVEAHPGQMYAPLPVVHFKPIINYVHNEEEYACPLYKTSVRAGILSTTGQSTNYVLSVSLPIPASGPPANPDFWVLQGTALLCALND